MIEIKDLVKTYGHQTAVDHLTFTVKPGKIYGFLGPNGAGKSTTMNIITGYIAADSGEVAINGHNILAEPEEAKRCIGYLPEVPPLYPDMRILEYLDFAAELKKIKKSERRKQVDEVIDLTGLEDVEDRMIKNLSKGYRQRVGLAQAILGYPEVIILDEPMVGLDPKQIIEIRQLIRKLGEKHTVILSSHILSEVSEVCDYLFILSKGKLVASDTTENLLGHMSSAQEIELRVKGKGQLPVNLLSEMKDVEKAEQITCEESGCSQIKVRAIPHTDIREDVFRKLADNGIVILEMNCVVRSLEDVFLELTGEEEEGV